MAEARRRELDVPREIAAELGRSAVEIAQRGFYFNAAGEKVEIGELVARAASAKQSLPPDAALPNPQPRSFAETRIQVANETTLEASRWLMESGHRPLALNFVNGVHPGGGFLHGAKAQEEVLCRSSALYRTLAGDPMYKSAPRASLARFHRLGDLLTRRSGLSTRRRDRAGPAVAAEFHHVCGSGGDDDRPAGGRRPVTEADSSPARDRAGIRLFDARSRRLGCGAFGNDPRRTAADFRYAIENEFRGVLSDIVFAIIDWSPERKFLGPFRDVFA
jgi:hypothetical protein